MAVNQNLISFYAALRHHIITARLAYQYTVGAVSCELWMQTAVRAKLEECGCGGLHCTGPDPPRAVLGSSCLWRGEMTQNLTL